MGTKPLQSPQPCLTQCVGSATQQATIMPQKLTVAVIGLGASGLVTMKNLAEEGFHVTGFERSGSIGGVWSYEDTTTKTTVLKSMFLAPLSLR
jgi:cation diffusion facilitator CzcD-associated flavoprotein CzcO